MKVTWGKDEIIEYSDVYDVIESYTKNETVEQSNMSFLKDTPRREIKNILIYMKKWKY